MLATISMIVWFLLSTCSSVYANESKEFVDAEELESSESEGSDRPNSASPAFSAIHYYGHFLVKHFDFFYHQAGNTKLDHGELQLNLNWDLNPALQLYTSQSYHFRSNADGQHLVDQLGIRSQVTPNLTLSLGKERSVRAPGQLVNPSDFIYPPNVIPGQVPRQTGRWMLRASLAKLTWSLDIMYLPELVETNSGLISERKNNHQPGFALRNFFLWNDWEIGLSLGREYDRWQYSFSLSGYIDQGIELHSEYFRGDNSETQLLVGSRLDVSERGIVFVEWLNQNNAQAKMLNAKSSSFALSIANILSERNYLLTGASIKEYLSIFDVFFTGVYNPKHSQILALTRIDWLASSHVTLAGTLGISRSKKSKGKIFGLELRYSF